MCEKFGVLGEFLVEVIRKAYPWDLEPLEVTNGRLATRADYASGWVQGSRG